MRFAVALPWWGYVLAFAVAVAFAWLAYARVALPLSRGQRGLLVALRAVTLVLIVVFLLRPVRVVEAETDRDRTVPILVDVSRSMRLPDGDTTRIARAQELAAALEAAVGQRFRTEVLSFGDALARTSPEQLSPDARRSDLSGALAALADRFRGTRLAGVIVVSDGGDTSAEEAGTMLAIDVPVFTIGVGDPVIERDREVNNLTAGEPLLAESSVDLSVSVTSSGFGTSPIELRLSADGRPIETPHVAPSHDGAPVHQRFTVSPSADRATVYTVEIPAQPGELVTENNRRSVLVPPQGRTRRVLLIEGAPGFEHTFLKRALSRDTGLDVDAVVRTGQNAEGRNTYFIQAASRRASALASGFPPRRADLFQYDAVFFGNLEADYFTRDQLELLAEFVERRGGGLLVFGARSFEQGGLAGTALDEVLPVDLTDRRVSVARASSDEPLSDGLALTSDGDAHPATRLAVTVEESRRRWTSLPPLASVVNVGAPRPGAQVLAVASTGGAARPLIVTQRYGQGRSLVFAGEASWRWRMMLPASDSTYELVWRQLARWVAAGAPDRIEILPAAAALPETTESVSVLVRDEEFAPVSNAEVTLRVTEPGGRERTMTAALTNPREGRYAAAVRFDQPGVYGIAADVRRDGEQLGAAARQMLVGGADLELAQPRLNDAVLRRIAEASGGRYVPAADAATVPELLEQTAAGSPPTEMRDVWHNGFSLAAIILLLAAEWGVRRRVGLA